MDFPDPVSEANRNCHDCPGCLSSHLNSEIEIGSGIVTDHLFERFK